MNKPPRTIISIVGLGTVLSLVYSALNYGIQISLVEFFGYRMRGVFEILMSIVGLASVLFSFNYYTALNLHVAEQHGAPRNIVRIGSLILGVQVLALFVMYAVSPKQGIVEPSQYWVFLALLIVAAVLNHKVNEHTAVLNGHHFFLQAKILSLIGAATSAVLILLAYACGHTEVSLIVWLAVLGPFGGSYAYAKILTYFQPALVRREGEIRPRALLRENGGVYLISLAQFISIKFYLLYIAQQESVEILGIFSLAYSITQFVLLPATLLATIIISSKTDGASGLSRAMRLLVGYGVGATVLAKLCIGVGMLEWLPFKSFQNPMFASMLGIMVVSVPFNVLNILTVAMAIRQRHCSVYFIGSQLLLIPGLLIGYLVLRHFSWSASAAAASYVLTWAIASLASLAALQRSLRITRIASCTPSL